MAPRQCTEHECSADILCNSFGVITLLLAMIFKLLPNTQIAWSDVWIGAAIASLFFTIGKLLIGLYLGGSAVVSTYGAVSAPLVILVWIYYSAQILIFGGEVTHVYANKHRSRAKSPLIQRLPVERSQYHISSPHPG
jgi:membrane protein